MTSNPEVICMMYPVVPFINYLVAFILGMATISTALLFSMVLKGCAKITIKKRK